MKNGFKKLDKKKKISWAETGTSIFAFLNIIVASISLLICLSILVLYIIEFIINNDIDAIMWCLCLGTNLVVLIVFVFAVLLFLGVYQKRSRFLLAYVIFGAIVDIALLSTVVTCHYVYFNVDRDMQHAFGKIYEPVTLAIIGICVVHTLLLIMIRRAWFLMKSRCSEDCKKLVNHCDEGAWRTG